MSLHTPRLIHIINVKLNTADNFLSCVCFFATERNAYGKGKRGHVFWLIRSQHQSEKDDCQQNCKTGDRAIDDSSCMMPSQEIRKGANNSHFYTPSLKTSQ